MNQEQVQVKTPEYVSLQFQSAGLGSRASAFIIDQVIIMIANFTILIGAIYLMDFMGLFMGTSWVPIAIVTILAFLINWGYFFFLEYFTGGRTIGKKMLGIRVMQENGHSITLLSSFIRNLLRIVDQLPAGYLLGILMIFFHSKHKRLGDLAAGTLVVHERRVRKRKKKTAIEKEIERRGITRDDWKLEEWTIKSFKEKDWNLLKTYVERYLQVPLEEREQLTKKVSSILIEKVGIDTSGKTTLERERMLFTLYLHLKDEWEFE
ncbi:RDD family protein [Halalkalibacter sp. APA_J-10(15)]|uniref:RDD family protein n=1 Tax=unclassified Halalkalibacter TaxID=2893063 RepID=UPI001FF12781|nr:RDD family protein [Halalkalibacter sp. APA_J-10(15)]MCK0469935.1 RDD family protein [Halalkalibacter sp. APA_J-10(15)]